MLHSVLWLKSVLEVGFYFFTWDLRSDLRAWFIYAPNSYLFRMKSTFKTHNKCLYNLSVFPDNRGRWHQSVFYQVLAEIPLISYCKVFTNKRGLLFYTQFILRGTPIVFFRCASISSTYPSKSVRPLVGNTFEFPLPLNISVQQSSLMSISYFISSK